MKQSVCPTLREHDEDLARRLRAWARLRDLLEAEVRECALSLSTPGAGPETQGAPGSGVEKHGYARLGLRLRMTQKTARTDGPVGPIGGGRTRRTAR